MQPQDCVIARRPIVDFDLDRDTAVIIKPGVVGRVISITSGGAVINVDGDPVAIDPDDIGAFQVRSGIWCLRAKCAECVVNANCADRPWRLLARL